MKNIILRGIELDKKILFLKQVKIDRVTWKTYYLDEQSEEKWVKEHPHSEMHGGGSPELKRIEKFPWEEKGLNDPD